MGNPHTQTYYTCMPQSSLETPWPSLALPRRWHMPTSTLPRYWHMCQCQLYQGPGVCHGHDMTLAYRYQHSMLSYSLFAHACLESELSFWPPSHKYFTKNFLSWYQTKHRYWLFMSSLSISLLECPWYYHYSLMLKTWKYVQFLDLLKYESLKDSVSPHFDFTSTSLSRAEHLVEAHHDYGLSKIRCSPWLH